MSTIIVRKLTNESLMRRANSFTTGKDSRMSLEAAYRHGHSPIRTQLFWVELTDIPLFVASQLVRSHVGIQYFQRSKRPDRGGEDFKAVCEDIYEVIDDILHGDNDYPHDALDKEAERVKELPKHFDRFAPTDLAFICNAEALINMSHKRLCKKASKETREIFQGIADEIEHYDPALYAHLVPQCIYRGGICPEPKCCGWITTTEASVAYSAYLKLFIQHSKPTEIK